MSQILFLDTPENFSNLILKKKISVKNGFFLNFLEIFWNFLERTGQKWVKKWRAQGQHYFIFFKILSGFQKCPSFSCRPGGSTRKSRFCEARWSRKSKNLNKITKNIFFVGNFQLVWTFNSEY